MPELSAVGDTAFDTSGGLGLATLHGMVPLAG
jgi:hypothetical protein